MKLTIGMSCFNDFDGVWFTINSVLQYHPEVRDDIRFVVIDGNPDSSHGKACEELISKLTNKHGHMGLYVKNVSWAGTASRDYIFQYAKTPYVICVDSHVMLYPGTLKKLIDYYDTNSDNSNLIQGPLYTENGDLMATSMEPVWDYNMYGKWVKDQGLVDKNEPWEVDLMGLGMFSCRKSAWLNFNPAFRGFGGEEGYIHQKYKNVGKITLMLPWLKWVHRFSRPGGVPYINEYIDRVKNYFIGWHENKQSTQEIIDYFATDNNNDGQQRLGISRHQLQALDEQCKEIVNRQIDIASSETTDNEIINQLTRKIKQLETSLGHST